ncbi:MAG: TIGR04255 family protein [Planctomycetes bacterium]|nr:TIGR04255 family protein [Planctomycetota bacterium]
MSLASKFRINTAEIFPRLTKSPIVEAAIEVRAQAKITWDEPLVTEQLKTKLPDYPNTQSQREFKSTLEFGIGKKAKGDVLDMGWKGLRFESADKLHIAQFNRDSFLFSRLQPYDSWEQFCDEGLRLWQLYMNLAKPTEIQRVGLRFINRMELSQDEQMEDYLQILPQKPQGLDIPIGSFFHHEVLNVPDYPYAINIRRTIQPPNKATDKKIGLILDIDVFTIQPFEPKIGIIGQYLAEMRWLKNKVFYGNITPKAREAFR